MKILTRQVGNTLIELTVALAITGIIAVPLTGAMSAQLSIPAKITRRVAATSEELSSTLVISEDAAVAQSFTPGTGSDYGTFAWSEFSVDTPIPTSSRYTFTGGAAFRVVERSGEVTSPQLVVGGIKNKDDITFTHILPKWDYDAITKTWSYTEGKIVISIIKTRETEEGEASTTQQRFVADFRPEIERPVVPPPPSNVADLSDRH